MQQGIITARIKRKAMYFGNDIELIGAEQESYGYDHKPVKRGFTGKTGFKLA